MSHSRQLLRIIVATVLVCGAGSIGPTRAADEQPKAVRAAVERGLVVLQRAAREYPSHQSCFACHHQTLPLLALKAARDAGLKCDEELFLEQQKFTRKSFGERQERLAKGEHVGGRAATVSYGLWTLSLAGDEPDELGAAMTAYLLSVQLPDGSWKPPSNRPPLEVSAVSCTVLSAIGIQRFASAAQKDRVDEAVARAKTWLASAPLPEQEDVNFALWDTKLLGGTGEQLDLLRERVLANRQADGGWSQNATLKSDAYATGQTLYVLAETGLPPGEAAVREGIAFLLETQQEDGSWHVATRSKPIQPWFDNGDPHGKDQFISIAATGWATAALARSLPRVKAPGQ
jgi:N-acyl-D-amino-acid deacylase